MGTYWRRRFRFVIPVRNPDLWSSKTVSSGLVETLGFLPDDDYSFEFNQLSDPPPPAGGFEFGEDQQSAFVPDEVVLFSGGLDSLAGAVEELAKAGKRVALVSHRSAPLSTLPIKSSRPLSPGRAVKPNSAR